MGKEDTEPVWPNQTWYPAVASDQVVGLAPALRLRL